MSRVEISPREAQVTQLLLDWADEFPPAYPGGEEMMSFGGGDPSYGDDWPLNAEALRRMDKTTLVGQTYATLEKALKELESKHPILFRAINAAYLDPDVSHSEVAHWRSKAKKGSARLQRMVELHDKAIGELASILKDAQLWVRWSTKVAIGNLKDMAERHEELVRVFHSYRSEGHKYSRAVSLSATKCGYTTDHARTVIKSRVRA